MHRSPFTSDTEIETIARGLLDRTLPKREWTHAAHFAAALWFLAERPVPDVTRELPVVIKAYNVSTGVANTESGGYHETITFASIRAAWFWLRRTPARPICEVANDLIASDLGSPNWLLAYWSAPRLFSVYARLNWCDPDIRILPF